MASVKISWVAASVISSFSTCQKHAPKPIARGAENLNDEKTKESKRETKQQRNEMSKISKWSMRQNATQWKHHWNYDGNNKISHLLQHNSLWTRDEHFRFFFRWFFQEISFLRVFKVTKIKIYHIICYVRLYFSIRKTIDNQQKENFLISSIYRTQKLIALRRFMLPGYLQKKEKSIFFHFFPLERIHNTSKMLGQTELRWAQFIFPPLGR